MLGPLLELELPTKFDTVPEGLKISPAHFLSVPDDESFRSPENHEHHIVKVSQDDDGEFTMKKFGTFTRVTDNFCFETEDLKHQTFCYVTTTTLESGEKEEILDCDCGVSTTTVVIQKEGKCPHEDGALDSFVLCKSRIECFKKMYAGKFKIQILDLDQNYYPSLDKSLNYKINVKEHNTKTDFESVFKSDILLYSDEIGIRYKCINFVPIISDCQNLYYN